MRRKKRCFWCRRWFLPRSNIGGRQKVCGRKRCGVVRKKEANRRWHRANRQIHLQMIRDWFVAHPGYLKAYRLSHPEYRRKNIKATLTRRLQTLFDKKTSKSASPLNICSARRHSLFDKTTSSPFDSS